MAYLHDIQYHDSRMYGDDLGCEDYGIKVGDMPDGSGINRVWLHNIVGYPKIVGIRLKYLIDVPRILNCHFHPDFCLEQPRQYNRPNGTAIWLEEAHNPIISGCFSFGYQVGLHISGPSKKVFLDGVGADAARYGYLITGNDATVFGSHVYAFGRTDVSLDAQIGLWVMGSNNEIHVSQLDIEAYGKNGVRVEGYGNNLFVDQLRIVNCALESPAWPGLEVASGNNAYINTLCTQGVELPYASWPRGLSNIHVNRVVAI